MKMTLLRIYQGQFLTLMLFILNSLLCHSIQAQTVGVPRLDPDYNVLVTEWWATHRFNPESVNYQPVIASPSPAVNLVSGQSIQAAINSLPANGGTINLAPGTYGAFNILARNNVHVISTGGAIIRGICNIAVSERAIDYGAFDLGLSKKIPEYVNDFRNPTKNFYFKNLIFDGGGTLYSGPQLKRVYDVVFDGCTFQNFRDPGDHHRGVVNGHMGLNNIWFRGCHFIGKARYVIYLDGVHAGGLVNNIIEGNNFSAGGFLYLTNDDFSEDANANGVLERSEERNAKYIVAYGNTFNGNQRSALQVMGENVLFTKNKLLGTSFHALKISSKWSDIRPTLQYRSTDIFIVANEMQGLQQSILELFNYGSSAPLNKTPAVMGRYHVLGNRTGPLPTPVFVSHGPIIGPNEICGNCFNNPACTPNPRCSSTVDQIEPTAPSNIRVTGAGPSTISIGWTASVDNVGVTGYRIYRNGAHVGSVAGLAFTDSNLNPGTGYTYVVRAVDAAGNLSQPSSLLNASTTADSQAPSVPSNLRVTGLTSVSVSLAWSPSTDLFGVSGYIVFRNGVQAATTSGSTQTVSGLTPDTEYSFTVKARDVAGNLSAASAPVIARTATSVPTIDVVPPTAPGNLRVTGATTNSINLAWSASQDNVGVLRYMVYLSGRTNNYTSTTNLHVTVPLLKPGQTYSFEVRAKDRARNLSTPALVTGSTASVGATDPKVLAYDSFSGPDQGTLHGRVSDSGHQWNVHKGTFALRNQSAIHTSNPALAQIVGLASVDMVVEAKITLPSVAPVWPQDWFVGLFGSAELRDGRIYDGFQARFVWQNGVSLIELWEYAEGKTVMGLPDLVMKKGDIRGQIQPGGTYTLRLTIQGRSVSACIVEKASTTSVTMTAGRTHSHSSAGLAVASQVGGQFTGSWDDFKVSQPVGTASPVPTPPGTLASDFPLGMFEDGNLVTSNNYKAMIDNLRTRGFDSLMMVNGHSARYQDLLGYTDTLPFNVFINPTRDLNQHWWPTNIVANLTNAKAVAKTVVDAWKNHSSLKGYYLADEPPNSLREKLSLISQAFRELDSTRPNFPVLIGVDRVGPLFQASEAGRMVIDVYPCAFRNAIGDFTMNGFGYGNLDFVSYIQTVTSTRPSGTPLWLILQAHNIGDGSKFWHLRKPVASELRSQHWMALGEGATGIFWFIYSSQQGWTGLKDEPGHMAEVQSLNQRTIPLRNILKQTRRTATNEFMVTGAGPRPHYVSTLVDQSTNRKFLIVVNRDCLNDQMLKTTSINGGRLKNLETNAIVNQGVEVLFRAGDGAIFEVIP